MGLMHEAIANNAMMQDPREFRWLIHQLKERNVKRILEIGSFNGATAEAMVRNCKGTLIRCIDNCRAWEGTAKQLRWTIEALREDGYDADYLLCDSHSEKAVKWAEETAPYDFVFIDGDHTYEGAKADWMNYFYLGRLIGFHDIGGVEPGVQKLWSEILPSAGLALCVLSPMGIGLLAGGVE